MSDKKKVSLLFIGTELTNGTVQDTHTRYITPRLGEIGMDVRSVQLLPDDRSITGDLKREADLSDIVIVAGGLGPTSDDLTREIIAEAAGSRLLFDQRLWESITERFEYLSGAANRNQAFVPEGFEAIPNRRGTAPGLTGSIGDTLVFVLPGPPREMQGMFDEEVFPLLRRQYGFYKADMLEASCFLVCESGLEEACRSIPADGLTWGTRVQRRRISLYIRGGNKESRVSFLHSLQNHFGEERIRQGDIDLPAYVFNLFREKKKKMACAESFTGGLFGKTITDFPGSSEVFSGGVITYTVETKEKYLGINRDQLDDFGAVSRVTAVEMASSVRKISAADFGISFTGIAGPGGGTEKTPVGTVWIGISSVEGGASAFPFSIRGSRDRIRSKAVIIGFLLLEMSIKESKSLDSKRMWQYSKIFL